MPWLALAAPRLAAPARPPKSPSPVRLAAPALRFAPGRLLMMEAHGHRQRCDPKPPSSLTHPVTWTLDTRSAAVLCGWGRGGHRFSGGQEQVGERRFHPAAGRPGAPGGVGASRRRRQQHQGWTTAAHPTPHAGAPPAVPGLHLLPRPSMVCLSGPTPPPFPPGRCVKHPGLCVLYVSHVCGRISASAGNLVSVSHIFAITPRRPIGSAHLSEVHVRSPRGPAACGGICG